MVDNTRMGFAPYLPRPNQHTGPLSKYVSDTMTSLVSADNAIRAQIDAITGSEVANVPAGDITATNVQDAITQLDTAVNLRLLATAYTAADVLAKLITVDGAGSGLDADLLGGISHAAFSLITRTPQAGTTRNLALTDAGNLIWNNTGGAITLTIPTNATVAFPVWTQIDLLAWNTTITIAAAGGVTLHSPNSLLTVGPQFAGATLIQVAIDTWALFGALQ